MAKRPAKRARKRAPARRPRPRTPPVEEAGEVTRLPGTLSAHPETSPSLSGGDLDADWLGAEAAGEETVGGSVATPDQDVVDELGHALGVEQEPTGEVRTSGEILHERDREYWRLEAEAADEEEGRRRGRP